MNFSILEFVKLGFSFRGNVNDAKMNADSALSWHATDCRAAVVGIMCGLRGRRSNGRVRLKTVVRTVLAG